MKRTNKIWRSLALLLVLCMLPTVALANSGATVTIVGDVTEEAGAITVNANTTVAGNDITILAFRAGETVDAIPAEAELEESLVFIEQVTSDDEGNATFSFIPRAVDASYGGYVHIYVGGENMTGAPAHASIDNRPPAPVLDAELPTVWYAGHDTLDFAVAEDLAYVNAWAATLQEGDIKVTGVKEEDDTPVTADAEIIGLEDMIVAEGKITFNLDGLKSISKIAIDANDAYTGTSAIFSEALVRSIIPAGTLTATSSGTISPVTVAIEGVAGKEGVPTDWAEGASANESYGYAEFTGETAKEDLVYTPFDEGTDLQLVLPSVETGERQFYIRLAVENCETKYYGPYTVTSPATDAKKKLESDQDIKINYDANDLYTSDPAYNEDEVAQMTEKEKGDAFGAASITLPTTGENGTSIAWTKDGEEVSGKVPLERPASGGVPVEINFVATITVPGTAYTDEWVFTKTVNPYGVSGVDVSITLTGGVAKGATVKLMDGDIEVAELVAQGDFTFHKTTTDATYNTVIFASEDKVAAGEYTLVISRPGFVTKSQAVTVADEDLVIPTLAATDFVFGDNRGMTDATPDGKVLTPDYNALCVAFKVEGNYALALDYNGDGVVETIDYNALCSNFNYGK